jgi:hypothetical protein
VEHTEIILVPDDGDENKHSEQKVEEEEEVSDDADVIIESNVNANANANANVNNTPSLKEMKHLQKRVKNVRESIQTSVSITNPTTYENNVLNAVTNCINEWRAIAIHYNDNNEDHLDPDEKKQTSLAVFQLIQYSLQCGPLEGANPGYFKRCGSQVAKVVLEFLEAIVCDSDKALEKMGFTTKQVGAMEKWKSQAQKAVEADKPPSKSALKTQQGKKAPKKNKKVKG